MNRPYPQLLLIGLIIVLAGALLVASGTSSASLGAYNSDWDGTSEIQRAAESADTPVTVARNISQYGQIEPNGSVAMVLSPTDPYGADAAVLRSYVRSGGTLLIAEDYGSGGNELLEAIGADARIDGAPLRDEQEAGPSPAFPRTSTATNHTYTTGVETLMLNHGTAIDATNATTLVNSSSFSYLDQNRNSELDDTEELGSRPVVTIESVGSGTVVVISDPSLFINSMLDRSDNAAFLQAIVGNHDHVLLDVSHTDSVPPLVAVQLTLQESPLLAFFVGTISVVGLIAIAHSQELLVQLRNWRHQTVEQPTLSRDALATSIRNRHPEWDDERIDRVTGSLIRRRTKERNND